MKQVKYAFISTGEETKMYTLRHAYQVLNENGDIVAVGSTHICNLSTNRDSAIEKAMARSKVSGVDLHLDVELFELNSIVRGENKERKLTRQEKKELKEKEKQEQIERDYQLMLSDGKMQIGKYRGLTAHEVNQVNPSYIAYAANQYVEGRLNQFNVNAKLCKEYAEMNNLITEPKEPSFIGRVNDVLDVEGDITNIQVVDGLYGKQLLVNIQDDAANVVRLYTTSKFFYNANIGQKVLLQGAVVKKNVTKSNSGFSIIGGRIKASAVG